jgi:hypothetical protein
LQKVGGNNCSERFESVRKDIFNAQFAKKNLKKPQLRFNSDSSFEEIDQLDMSKAKTEKTDNFDESEIITDENFKSAEFGQLSFRANPEPIIKPLEPKFIDPEDETF